MITYCSNCKINWAALYTETLEEICEYHDVCPRCRQRWFLEEGNDLFAYYYNYWRGEFINADTEQIITEAEMFPKPKVYSNYKERPPFDPEAWQRQKDEYDLLQDAAIQVYTDACDAGEGQEAAEKKYFAYTKAQIILFNEKHPKQ